MRKLIHSNFELDLQNFKLVDVDNNSNFADTQFVRSTFPFEIDLNDDLDIALGFISAYTTNPQTIYECIYCHNDLLEKAELEINEINGRKLSCVLQFGLENFPNWDKKLSELPLLDFSLAPGNNIQAYAENIISQGYPNVRFNFPQVHTDKYDTSDSTWEFFEKILNKRVAGLFPKNTIDTSTADIGVYNRNILQPMPYLLYVLKTAIEDANYTLAGDILTDQLLKNKLIVSQSQENFVRSSKIEFAINFDLSTLQQNIENYNGNNIVAGLQQRQSIIIDSAGIYSCLGIVRVFSVDGRVPNDPDGTFFHYNGYFQLSVNGVLIKQIIVNNQKPPIFENILQIFTMYFNAGNEVSVLFKTRYDNSYDDPIVDLDFYKICDLDVNREPTGTIYNNNTINLKKSVPDMTFGELVNIVKNWFNYSFDIVGQTVVMNKILSEINTNDSILLNNLEVKEPTRRFQSGLSFLHKFADIDSKLFSYKKVFQNRLGVFTENFKEDKKTNTIEVNGLPLPQYNRTGITTAYEFDGSDNKLYLVDYDGLVGGENYTKPSTNIFLENIHTSYWLNWLSFRINAVAFKWKFKSFYILLNNLRAKSVIFAYQKYHIIKSIQRTEIASDLFEYDIDTES